MRNIASDRLIGIDRAWIRPILSAGSLCDVVTGNVDRARRRVALGQERLRVDADVYIRDERGDIAHDPPDDKLVPQASGETLAAHSLFPTLGPSWNIEEGRKCGSDLPQFHYS